MSIKQQRTITEKSLAAHRKNARQSQGPATAAGKQRARDASLRHGFYSQDRDTALRALGEEPEDFAATIQSVREKYAPEDGFEERLAMQLARAIWRMERADRMQEGCALRQARDVDQGREPRLHALMMRLKMMGATLQSLAQSVAREHYVTTPADLALMKNLLPEESMKEMGEIALALFLQLQEPGENDEQGRHIDPNEVGRRALARIKQIFGLDRDTPPVPRMLMIDGRMQPVAPPPGAPPVAAPPPPAVVQAPNLSPREWEKREPVRQLLENLLTRQAELCDAQRAALRRECLAGPSTFERAAEIAPTHPDDLLIQRMRDSSFREVWRLTHLLMKIKQQSAGRETRGNHRGSRTPPAGEPPTAMPGPEPSEGAPYADVAPTAKAARAAERRPTADNHPGAHSATPPKSGGEPHLKQNSPPQMRRGGAPSDGVVLSRGRVPIMTSPTSFAPACEARRYGDHLSGNVAPTLRSARECNAGGQARVPGQSKPTPRPVGADLKVSSTPRQHPLRRRISRNRPGSRNVLDNKGTYGFLASFHPDASSLKTNKLSGASTLQGNQNKHTKMKVHPEKSFRISTTRQITGANSSHPEILNKKNGLRDDRGSARLDGFEKGTRVHARLQRVTVGCIAKGIRRASATPPLRLSAGSRQKMMANRLTAGPGTIFIRPAAHTPPLRLSVVSG